MNHLLVAMMLNFLESSSRTCNFLSCIALRALRDVLSSALVCEHRAVRSVQGNRFHLEQLQPSSRVDWGRAQACLDRPVELRGDALASHLPPGLPHLARFPRLTAQWLT